MPRDARRKSESGIYHILLRGLNRQTIFIDDEDCDKFIQCLIECKALSGFKLMAYCLMGNHLHMLIKEEKEQMEQIYKRIGLRYVYWYKRKYRRTGHLFQDRYKSEPVDDDGYFLSVLRYIHQNPVKAGLCKEASEYRWSSYNDYINGSGITDAEFVLSLFKNGKEEAKKLFVRYMNEAEIVNCLDLEENQRPTDKEAREIIGKLCGTNNSAEFQNLSQEKKEKNIALLKENGLSIRQISRLTGISFGIIRKY